MKRVLTLLPLAALALAACGDDGDQVTIENAWARNSPAAATLGAVYFDVTVDADDVLLRADVADSVADHAEVHEVVAAEMDGGEMGEMDDSGDMAGSDDMDDGDMDDGDMDDGDMDDGAMDDGAMEGMGAMRMQEMTDGLPLTADETVSLEPGGYHVMLIDLVEPLELGDEIELTLEFAEAGETTLTVEVAETAP
ncbi:MAG: copper chaperone PCu(A)C [Ilumatobacter sp.]|uniref:copper chaperone PCu(A)C n=1 Tax=Ilumatobacter sp. TaxID=1967498 RepID=UPI002612E2FC|nr:copper chaperone PCu(A)C [Ilumatobacter sp.]MDJ0769060.1 copper chaperone PCu(A)C [Ilumatobacter sp.]